MGRGREREKESEADSTLSPEPNVGLNSTTAEIVQKQSWTLNQQVNHLGAPIVRFYF